MKNSRTKAAPCPKCGTAPKITAKIAAGKRPAKWCLFDNEVDYDLKTNPDCPVCGKLARHGYVDSPEYGVQDVIESRTKAWNRMVSLAAKVLRLDDAGKLAPIRSCGCSAMMLAPPSVDAVLTRLWNELDEDETVELAGISDDGAFADKLFAMYAETKCSVLGGQCPRGTAAKKTAGNMECCLPAYAASHPADKLDDETLAAVAGLVGCLGCDALGKHWYLSECGNCPGVDAHLKCYYLASEYRKRMESRKGSAK